MNKESNYIWTKEIQFPPFRSLNEFIFLKTGYFFPPLNDFRKWNDRIFGNLLYFQNYYFIFLLAHIYRALIAHPKAFILGFIILGICGLIIGLMGSKEGKFSDIRREHSYLIFIAMIIASYFLITYCIAVFITLFYVCSDLLLILIHASIRLPRFKLKKEFLEGSIRETVMAKILQGLMVERVKFPVLLLPIIIISIVFSFCCFWAYFFGIVISV